MTPLSKLDRWWTGVVGVLAVGYAAWSLAMPPSGLRSIAGLALVLVAQGVAALSALWAARRLVPGAERRTWRVFGTGWLLWTIGAVLNWGTWGLRGALPAIPSASDLLYLAGAFSFLWALASYPANPPERFGRLRDLLDVLIITLAVLTMGWFALLRPVVNALLASSIVVFWTGIRPALDLLFLALLLRVSLLVGPAFERRPLALLGATGALLTLGDLVGGYQLLLGEFQPGTWIDLAWIGAAWAAALAAIAMRPAAEGVGPQGGQARRRIEALLPIVFTYAVVGFTLLDAYLTKSIDSAGLAVSVALSALLVARQGVVAGQSEMRQYASLVHASADLAFICDRSGRLRLYNPAFAGALGAPAKPSQPVSLTEFLAGTPSIDNILLTSATAGWSGEVFLRRRDGTSFPALLTLRPVENPQGPEALIAGNGVDLTGIRGREDALRTALRDVAAARTELQSLNVELERKVEARTAQLQRIVQDLDRLNRELKELDKLKTEFVTLVSHELRAPLTNIRSGLELMLAAHPTLESSVRETLTIVEDEAARLGRFVEAILDLSALEAGRFPLQPYPVSIVQSARLAVERFRGHPAYGRMQVAMPADLPEVTADERALGSVFLHLLDNAAKYAGSGPITVGAEAAPDRVNVHIEDSGPGIPEA
ncbi:MAG TPA: PAS domain-containing sensor histidine kinase, partial [Anaerolineales bacterium]|nr:PAS domain-containing sensor histidine kinase [Anaerolineales bacterium]